MVVQQKKIRLGTFRRRFNNETTPSRYRDLERLTKELNTDFDDI